MDGSTLNRRVYDRLPAGAYSSDGGLGPAEAEALRRVLDRSAPTAILDIGVGGGRTVGPLAALNASYVGVDYSPAMVAASRAAHPGLDIRQADARDLAGFADAAFDLAVFSFNGIDSVGPADRLQALAAIRRVLRPGSSFIFSTHNRLTPFQPCWRRDDLSRQDWRRYVTGILNHLRLHRRERQTAEYALINDRAHDHAMLVYYIDPANQRLQLERAGFGATEIIGLDGRGIGFDDSPRDPWLYYLCRAH